MTYEYHATAINVVDGDTLDVVIQLGFFLTITERVRLYGIDTPERGDPGYLDATVALRGIVMGFDPLRPPQLIVRSVKPHDKYGRWLATIETRTVPDVAQAMIDAGLGVPYYGGAKGEPLSAPAGDRIGGVPPWQGGQRLERAPISNNQLTEEDSP